jgi:hypothetical protein
MKTIILTIAMFLALVGCARETVKHYYIQELSTSRCFEVWEGSKIEYQMIECDTVPDGVELKVYQVWEEH